MEDDALILEEMDLEPGKTISGDELMRMLGHHEEKEIPEGKSFYLIWCKDSTPKVRHLTIEEVTRYAKQAANKQQRGIYILKAVALVTPTNEASVTDLY